MRDKEKEDPILDEVSGIAASGGILAPRNRMEAVASEHIEKRSAGALSPRPDPPESAPTSADSLPQSSAPAEKPEDGAS